MTILALTLPLLVGHPLLDSEADKGLLEKGSFDTSTAPGPTALNGFWHTLIFKVMQAKDFLL